MQKECGGGESLLLREAKRAKLKELSEIRFLQPLRIKLLPNCQRVKPDLNHEFHEIGITLNNRLQPFH